MKIGLVTSRGGHLFQLYQLKDWWQRYDRFWITERGGDSDYLLKNEKVYYGYFPESRNFINALRNLFLGFSILRREKPDLLFSCGAGIAPPIFLAGKILCCRLIFMEPYDFISCPSLSGRLVSPIVDKLLVQHKTQKKFFKKAEFWGATL
jgi:UDP-N-acetylglucosamine:LPS N-acetylglucosamine transferase